MIGTFVVYFALVTYKDFTFEYATRLPLVIIFELSIFFDINFVVF